MMKEQLLKESDDEDSTREIVSKVEDVSELEIIKMSSCSQDLSPEAAIPVFNRTRVTRPKSKYEV